MRKKIDKIAAIFIVSIFALSGTGMAFAAWVDTNRPIEGGHETSDVGGDVKVVISSIDGRIGHAHVGPVLGRTLHSRENMLVFCSPPIIIVALVLELLRV